MSTPLQQGVLQRAPAVFVTDTSTRARLGEDDNVPGPPGPPGPAGTNGTNGASGFGSLYQNFTATASQTNFTLSTTPADATKVVMIVDQMTFYPPDDFTVALNVVTWIGAPVNFDMEAGQSVRIYY